MIGRCRVWREKSYLPFLKASTSRSSSNRLYFDKSSSLPLSSSLLEACWSFGGGFEVLLLVDSSFRFESRSLDELDFRLRFGGDLRERFLLLRSDEEDDEELSLERDRDLDLERERERLRLERFEFTDLLLLLFFFRLPNSSYSESDDSRLLYSTTSRSLNPPP